MDRDTCRQLAPDTFGETGDFSFGKAQPVDPIRERSALHTLIGCPTGSIGTSGKSAIPIAVCDFPLPLASFVS